MSTSNPVPLSMDQLLKEYGLDDSVVELFRRNKITRAILQLMDKEDFMELGVTAFGDRKILQQLAQSLRKSGSTPGATVTDMPYYQQASLDEDAASFPESPTGSLPETPPSSEISHVCGLDVYDATNEVNNIPACRVSVVFSYFFLLMSFRMLAPPS